MVYSNNILFFNFISKALYSYLIKYPTPMNINYLWNFGFMSAIFLVIQIVSGLFLTFFFTPHVDLAFFSVEHIMRDVNYGWLIRYIHANGASFFFFLVYVHILKGIYYGSYYFPRTLVWFTGCIIYILMMATAFLGHVLPWGQMSYWAATVITNFVTVIPFVGKDIVYFVWGGYSINNATLNRFFSLHYLLPFVIAVLSAYHIYQLHKSGSSNELGIRSHYLNKISFYPYFLVKDFFGLFIILFFFTIFVFFFPEAFSHSDNYIKANPLVTPAHIVPEWYFLPLYGVLRSILNKTYGIIIMFVSLLVLFLLPFIDKSLIKNKTFKPFNRTLFWFFSLNFFFLGYLGSQTPVFPYIELGLIFSHFHLLYFFLLIPLSVFFESTLFNSLLRTNKHLAYSKGRVVPIISIIPIIPVIKKWRTVKHKRGHVYPRDVDVVYKIKKNEMTILFPKSDNPTIILIFFCVSSFAYTMVCHHILLAETDFLMDMIYSHMKYTPRESALRASLKLSYLSVDGIFADSAFDKVNMFFARHFSSSFIYLIPIYIFSVITYYVEAVRVNRINAIRNKRLKDRLKRMQKRDMRIHKLRKLLKALKVFLNIKINRKRKRK